jgi:hypothetical protein
MKPIFRTLAVAITFASLGIGLADAQTTAGNNPAQRGSRDTLFGPLSKPQGSVLGNGLGNDMIKRPAPRAGVITPVPEPSQWAMMLAGLALVGFIVKRRNNAR